MRTRAAMRALVGQMTVLAALALVPGGCADSGPPTAPPPPASARGVKTWISATGLIVPLDSGIQLGATVYDSITRNLPSWPSSLSNPWPSELRIRWYTRDSAAASVSPAGLVTPRAAGRVVVWVEVEGTQDSATLLLGAPPSLSRRYLAIAPGSLHTCALYAEGVTRCWGSDFNGTLGRGAIRQFTDGPLPASVSSNRQFASLASGELHTCGLTASGEAWCWGEDFYGELGDGRDSHSFEEVGAFGSGIPVAVGGGRTFTAVTAGGFFTCGLGAAGQAYCWGWNAFGQLGVGSYDASDDHRTQPTAVAGSLAFTTLAAGVFHVCALTETGAAYCWGRNDHAQLGRDSMEIGERCFQNTPCSTKPIAVAGDLRFTALVAGIDHTCGLTADGTAYCWGLNDAGQLGVESIGLMTNMPLPVTGSLRFRTLTAGISHTCGIASNGTAYCWGSNRRGQLGDGSAQDFTPHPVPRPVSGSLAFATLAAKGNHTCGIAQGGGALYCWGWNIHGQIGNGRTQSPDAVNTLVAPVPARVLDLD